MRQPLSQGSDGEWAVLPQKRWILCMNCVFISANEEEDGVYPSSECDGEVAFRAVLLMKFRISLKYESSLSSKMALPLSSSERGDDIAVPSCKNNTY